MVDYGVNRGPDTKNKIHPSRGFNSHALYAQGLLFIIIYIIPIVPYSLLLWRFLGFSDSAKPKTNDGKHLMETLIIILGSLQETCYLRRLIQQLCGNFSLNHAYTLFRNRHHGHHHHGRGRIDYRQRRYKVKYRGVSVFRTPTVKSRK